MRSVSYIEAGETVGWINVVTQTQFHFVDMKKKIILGLVKDIELIQNVIVDVNYFCRRLRSNGN